MLTSVSGSPFFQGLSGSPAFESRSPSDEVLDLLLRSPDHQEQRGLSLSPPNLGVPTYLTPKPQLPGLSSPSAPESVTPEASEAEELKRQQPQEPKVYPPGGLPELIVDDLPRTKANIHSPKAVYAQGRGIEGPGGLTSYSWFGTSTPQPANRKRSISQPSSEGAYNPVVHTTEAISTALPVAEDSIASSTPQPANPPAPKLQAQMLGAQLQGGAVRSQDFVVAVPPDESVESGDPDSPESRRKIRKSKRVPTLPKVAGDKPMVCTYETCKNPTHTSGGSWKYVTVDTRAGGKDWSQFVGRVFCNACFTQYATKGIMERPGR